MALYYWNDRKYYNIQLAKSKSVPSSYAFVFNCIDVNLRDFENLLVSFFKQVHAQKQAQSIKLNSYYTKINIPKYWKQSVEEKSKWNTWSNISHFLNNTYDFLLGVT